MAYSRSVLTNPKSTKHVVFGEHHLAMRIDTRDAIDELLYGETPTIEYGPLTGKHSFHVSSERFDEKSDS